jgi:CubicO group peptidase (beta-lactamase class C family)
MRFSLAATAVVFVACGIDELPEAIDVTYDPNSAYPEMDRLIGGSLNGLRVPGIAAIAIDDGQVAYEGYFGFADMDTGQRVTAESVFYLASVSKLVVAAAVMVAHEEESLALEQPVSELLDFAVVHPDAGSSPITLHHLATHTSGIEDNWDLMEPLIVDGDSPIALGEFLEGYLTPDGEWYSERRNFGQPPGTRAEYSNAGISLLAYAAGEADGAGFEALSQRAVFDALAMETASWRLAGAHRTHLASPHELRGGDYEPIPHYGYPDYPDGGLRVTARDLADFLIAHTNNSLFEQTTLDQMFQPQVPSLDPDQGIIWARYPDFGPAVVGHDGGDDGISTLVVLDTESRDGAVVLMNGDWHDNDLVNELALALLRFEP